MSSYIFAVKTMDGVVVSGSFDTFEGALEAAQVYSPEGATGGRTIPKLPDEVIAALEARAYEYEKGLFAYESNRFAVVFRHA